MANPRMEHLVGRRTTAGWAVWLIALCLAGTCGKTQAEDLAAAVKEQAAKYTAQLADLAAWCREGFRKDEE